MYTYDPKSDRWRNTSTGRYVNRETGLGFVQQSIDSAKARVTQLAQDQAAGDLSARQWLGAMRAEIKAEYIRNYMLGRGGRGMMEQKDWARLGGLIKDQYSYLDRFHDQLAAGEISPAQAANRAAMYMASAREAYERAHLVAVSKTKNKVKWVLGATEEHCGDCIDLAGKDWIAIDELTTYPAAGGTECLTNCDCHLEFQ